MSQNESRTGSPIPDESVTNCLKAVEDYRSQQVSKWEAISQIAAAIQSITPSTDVEQWSTAGSTYLAMLDEHDNLISRASNRGQYNHGQDNEETRYEAVINAEARSKHSISRSSSPESKRQKFNESLYAWKIREEITPIALSANLECTRSMVQNYTTNLKHALWSLQSAGSLPPFPKPEWKHVLSGMAVNLDVVFSGLFSTIADDKISTTIGDFDLSVSGTKPSITSKPMEIGPLPGTPHPPLSSVPSTIMPLNRSNMPNTFFSFSEPFLFPTLKSSTLTKQSTATSQKLSISSFPNLVASSTLKPITSRMTELGITPAPVWRKRRLSQITDLLRPVDNGTMESAIGVPPSAVIDTCVPTVEGSTHAWNVRRRIETSSEYMCPKFAWDLIWGADGDNISPSTRYSLSAEPLPRPPQSELQNIAANNTILAHPELFKITCNINVEKFNELLADHPNQPFVQSVITGLKEGFWPWAETQDGYPLTHNELQHPPKNDCEHDFLLSQREKEIKADRFSKPFDTLFPGMNIVPVHIVPKPPDDKLRLVVDHSAGPYSINSMIDHQSIAGVKLDGIKSLGDSIRAFHASHLADLSDMQSLTLWKLDVAATYRQMPMHPLWQIKQVVNINNQFCIDRCNNFGSRASQKIWWSFISLVLWISVFKHLLHALKCYVDDHFSVCIMGDLEFYSKYEAFLPSDQVRLLQLWDEINLPHEEEKQICGKCIPIIGFEVDPNAMTVTMSEARQLELIEACTAFTVRGARRTLQDFQKLQGWINWALNAFPHLQPSLCELYHKIIGKERPHAPIHVNNTMRRELLWFIHHVKISTGIHMLKSIEWSPYDQMATTLIGYTDASGSGMGIWFPGEYTGYQCPLPPSGPKDLIFFYEALTICSAFYLGAQYGCDQIAIYSDNTNAVDMFASLRAKPVYNSILMATVDFSIDSSIATKVYIMCLVNKMSSPTISQGS
jgi:hypothetical protein